MKSKILSEYFDRFYYREGMIDEGKAFIENNDGVLSKNEQYELFRNSESYKYLDKIIAGIVESCPCEEIEPMHNNYKGEEYNEAMCKIKEWKEWILNN